MCQQAFLLLESVVQLLSVNRLGLMFACLLTGDSDAVLISLCLHCLRNRLSKLIAVGCAVYLPFS